MLRTQVAQVPSGLRRQQPQECSRPGLRPPVPAAREHSVSIDCSEKSSWPGWGEGGGGLKAREIGYMVEQPVKLQETH